MDEVAVAGKTLAGNRDLKGHLKNKYYLLVSDAPIAPIHAYYAEGYASQMYKCFLNLYRRDLRSA